MAQIKFSNDAAILTKKSIWDSSLLSLLIANIITIAATLYGGWQLPSILAIYWVQSVTIGIFNIKRMKSLKNFTVGNISLNGAPVEATNAGKLALTSFFAIHYGGFHFVYLFFLVGLSFMQGFDFLGVLIASAIFIVNHYFSHKKNLEEDSQKLQSLGRLMFHPYARIIPMHLTIILSFIISGTMGLILFMSLKTAADLVGHMIEHSNWKLQSSLTAN